MMMNYSRLFRNPTPIRRIINPDEWVANVSRVLVQERWCETGKAICNGDIAGKIIQGIDLRLFRPQQLNTMIAVFDKYSHPGSPGYQARHRLLNHRDSPQQRAKPVRFRRNVAAPAATPEVRRQSPEPSSWFRQAAQLVAYMSCHLITSEQVIKGIDSALGCCLTGAGARRTPVVSDTRAQVDDSPHWISRC